MAFAREHILDGAPEDIVQRYSKLAALAERSDFGALDRNVVVVDTETTGFSFNHDELIQIAAARMDRGKIVDWYVSFVNPGKSIPEDITHLTGICDADVAGAPTPAEALASLVGFAGDATMVAHNVGFDKTFTTRHPEGYPLLDNVWVDSLDLSRIALPQLRSHRLIDLVHTFGAPVSTHRADDDVAATCVVYRILLAAVFSMPPSLVRAIADMAPLEEWSTSYVFKEASVLLDTSNDTPDNADISTDNTQYCGVETNVLECADTRRTDRFSVSDLRKRRIVSLPVRRARKDADDLAGQLSFPSAETIGDAFEASGIVGSIYESFEPRAEQRAMALAIRDAFERSENLSVEAGTGVGKSMAYLLPSALLAQENDIAVGVATKTNALLDQLVFQELPALAQALQAADPKRQPLTWAPLKGMSHYLCLRKVARLEQEGPSLKEVAGSQVSQAPALAAVLSFIDQSEFNDIDSLKIDYRALPRYQITTTSSECLRRKCPFYGKMCFVHGARRRAESADIIVTNHTLLFCDIAAEGGLLPTVRHWVVDEAHSTEEEARGAFASTVDSEALLRIAGRMADSSGARNVYKRAERSLERAGEAQATQFFALVGKARSAGNALARAVDDYVAGVKGLLFFDPVKRSRKGQSYEQVDIWINEEVRRSQPFADVAACATAFIETADAAIKTAQDVVAFLEGIDEAAVVQREIASLTMELRDARNAAELVFGAAPDGYAYQASLFKKKERRADKVQALMLDVGDKMNDAFYALTHSVVYASATLTVGGKFDSFEQAVGLNRSEFSFARHLLLDSSYDFDNNMIVYVVEDMPEPTDPSYLSALQRLLVAVHRAQHGSMLTLFTNRREMEQCYDAVAPELKQDDLRLVCQKWGVSVKGLRDDFLADEHLSLFALKSFWEGFDAPGATLKGVVIPKLPFARPTDPLYCERAARDDRAWWKYVLPQAVIETKQAAGRLIRKADDHGVLILADKRLVTKRYGKTFLGSLQSRTVRVCTTEEIVSTLSLMSGW